MATAAAYYYEADRVRADSWIPPYNLACLRALNGAPADALPLLGDAIERGLASRELLDGNPDLDTVRALPGWQPLLDRFAAATS